MQEMVGVICALELGSGVRKTENRQRGNMSLTVGIYRVLILKPRNLSPAWKRNLKIKIWAPGWASWVRIHIYHSLDLRPRGTCFLWYIYSLICRRVCSRIPKPWSWDEEGSSWQSEGCLACTKHMVCAPVPTLCLTGRQAGGGSTLGRDGEIRAKKTGCVYKSDLRN